MLLREIMDKNIISINRDVSLNEAYEIMLKNKIRHLPIMEDNKVVGIVTDRDLRLATSQLSETPFNPEVAVSNVMSSPVHVAHPNDPIGSAAMLMRELKIGCLPIVENKKLVGIITGIDILDAMIVLMGMDKPSGRLDVRLSDQPGELARLSKLLSDRNVNILSILSYTEEDGNMRVVLRINTMEIRKIASEICNSDFQVIWPDHISCVK